MDHGETFAGIGGFGLAASWMGWNNVFQIEIDSWCRKILKKNFPKTKQYGDIKEFKGQAGSVDILTGGFPCQPFSTAGKRKGESDDRYLWPEYFRVIREIKPAYVVGENVAGLISMENGKTLEGIFTDLESEGYQVESFIIPACGVGAWHRRDRIWIVAYMHNRFSKQQKGEIQARGHPVDLSGVNTPNTNSEHNGHRYSGKGKIFQDTIKENERFRKSLSTTKYWNVEPNMGRVAHGIPKRVDRLKGLGNAIVPQVAFEIFQAIQKLEDDRIHR